MPSSTLADTARNFVYENPLGELAAPTLPGVDVQSLTNNSPASTAIDRRTPVGELPQFLSVEQFADCVGIGRSSAYEFARRNGVRFGKLLRIPREAITR